MSFWLWANVSTWLEGSFFESLNGASLGVLSGLFIVLLSLLSVGFLLFQNRIWSLIFGFISGGIFFIFFNINNLHLVGVFIMVMLFYHAQDSVLGEVTGRIKIRPELIVRRSLMNLVLAFFILISFAAYESPAIDSFKNLTELPSSTSSFIKKVSEQTLSTQLQGATPEQKDYVLNQVTKELTSQFNIFLKPYFQYVPPALAFGLFLILWGVSWVFIGLATLIDMLLFKILKQTGFFKVEERDVKAEAIII